MVVAAAVVVEVQVQVVIEIVEIVEDVVELILETVIVIGEVKVQVKIGVVEEKVEEVIVVVAAWCLPYSPMLRWIVQPLSSGIRDGLYSHSPTGSEVTGCGISRLLEIVALVNLVCLRISLDGRARYTSDSYE